MSTALLTACGGMEKGVSYPSISFTSKIGYQEAFRRAETHDRECAPTVRLSRTAHIYTDNKTAVLRISLPETADGDLVVIDIKSIPTGSESKITFIDTGIFDSYMAQAIKRAIETGEVVCRPPGW